MDTNTEETVEKNETEQPKIENSAIKQIEDLKSALKQAYDTIAVGKEYNEKMAKAVQLFSEIHYTKEEKMIIAAELERAVTSEQIQRIYEKHRNNANFQADNVSDNEFVCSLGFGRELEKYYLSYKGFNPFQNIENLAKTIRTHFMLEDNMQNTDDPQKTNEIRNQWNDNWPLAKEAVNDIINITLSTKG